MVDVALLLHPVEEVGAGAGRIDGDVVARMGLRDHRDGALLQVVAGLDADSDRLRPGMEGVAKVTVGRASYAYTWTRRLQDWLRLALWRWMP